MKWKPNLKTLQSAYWRMPGLITLETMHVDNVKKFTILIGNRARINKARKQINSRIIRE